MFRKIFQIGILNTVRMNLYYFGWKGVLHAYIIASRSLKITELKGVIQYDGAKDIHRMYKNRIYTCGNF